MDILQKEKKIRKDKSDRATKEKVLDKKTLSILEKLQKRGILYDLEGCISSGKEANIYKGKFKNDFNFFAYKKINKDDNEINDKHNTIDFNLFASKKINEHDNEINDKNNTIDFNSNENNSKINKNLDNQTFNHKTINNEISARNKNNVSVKELLSFFEDLKYSKEKNIIFISKEKVQSFKNVTIKIYRTSILEFKNRSIYISN